ncbi:MAG: tetratricopeptide repeat protein [Mariprofundaceae bacterium]|nr:tetratricopeptide repeat protein [Mariprofundaceae bacterium]
MASERTDGIRVFLNNGSPEQAIRMSQALLSNETLKDKERFDLLSLIADAEEMRAKSQHYDDISLAVNALKTLKKEFPNEINAPELEWRLAWLHWKHGDEEEAMTYARGIRSDYAGHDEAVQAAMLMGRIYIQQKKWNEARSNLIQYGLAAKLDSREESLAKAWIAIVDVAEGRYDVALKQLDSAFKHYPEVVKKNAHLWSTYIQVLHMAKRDKDAIKQADNFLNDYLSGDYVASVRLLRADLWLLYKVKPSERIEREYDVLAEQQAEKSVGKKAFMRKLMIAHQKSQDYHTLKPVIIALKRLANQNQLSSIENEAELDLARLWKRLSHSDPKHSPKQIDMVSLEHFSRVARSEIKDYRADALHEGTAFFEQKLQVLLDAKKWVEVVAVWERFPVFRRDDLDVAKLQLGVAHALRMLMAYEQSEVLLGKLYQRANGSVWGQKVMLERERLWLDRGDKTGVERILDWLDGHEFTLYRPEMLLLVARMQLRENKPTAASQSITGISVDDITIKERLIYWQVRARIDEKLKHWHMAARAWREYSLLPGVDAAKALIEQANAAFKAKDYQKAEALYVQVDEKLRDAAWLYHYSICQLKTGKYKQALEKLEQQSQDASAGIYASLAALAIADKKAKTLLKEYP